MGRASVLFAFAVGCTHAQATTSNPSSVPTPPRAAPAPAPSPSVVATPDTEAPEDEGEWLDSFHVRFDPDPACRWSAECWHAPKQKPANAAKPPFSACHAEQRHVALDPESTKKARNELAKDACCYLSRICKLPLPKS